MRAPRDSRWLASVDCRAMEAASAAMEAASVAGAAARAAAVDFAVGLVADLQRGIVTREQLLACGLSADQISRRRARGWLRVIHRGVYAVGHMALPELALETAAVLALGEGAVLSHHSAAVLWGIRASRTGSEIDVTVVGRNPGPKRGIRLHRVERLDQREARRHRGLPTVSAARALLELAAELPEREVERTLDQALVQGVTNEAELVQLVALHPGRRGAARLRRLTQASRRPAITRSEAEERFLRLVRKAQLSQPEVNVPLGPYVVDFLWRAERVVIEIDGFGFHRDRGSFEADRRRDVTLRAAGYTVLRFTWRQLLQESEVILVRLGQVMPLTLRVRAG